MDAPATLARLRSLLLGTLVFGIAGMTTELLLLGHIESAAQWTPVVWLGVSALIVAWHAVAPSRATVRVLQATMMLLMLAGGIGVGLHYDGNVEFEVEMYPSMRGFELISKTLTGATPVLAPGTMALLGLVGLASVYRHPAIAERRL